MTLEHQVLGELFSGPGGLALGAHLAASDLGVVLEHGWANDYDPDSTKTYKANIPGASDTSVICSDVRDISFSSLPKISGLAFGFPCNDFSLVGKQKGIDGNFGPLYKYGVAALDALDPNWFVAENVGGIRSSNDGFAFTNILAELMTAGSSGYTITPHLYKFEQYGVPQTRHRVIIVGIRNDAAVKFLPPSPAEFESLDVSARTALTAPPIPPNASNNEFTKQSETVMKRLAHIKPGQNAFNADLPKELALNVKGAKLSNIYKRLDPSKPAYTLTGSGGGGTHVYHWSENRALTNRERARLQTFPDDYVFLGGKESVRKQIGMAVPVQGARVVFSALFKQLDGISTESVEPNLEKFHRQAADLNSRLEL